MAEELKPKPDASKSAQRKSTDERKQQIEQAKSEAELVKQEMLVVQNKEKVEADTARIRAVIAADQGREVRLTRANKELEVAKLENVVAQAQAEAKLLRAKAEGDVIRMKNEAEAAVFASQVQAFGTGAELARNVFYGKIAPRIQAILWTLWQLGIAKVTHDTEAQQINWEQGKHANITTRPFIEHFTEEGIAEGRALAAALSVVLQRTLRINGVELQVRAVDFDLLRAQSEELRKRQQDPKQDMAMAAARYLAELLAQGAGDKDLRFRAALELAADLGIRSLIVDAASRQLRIEGFNEQAALAAAFFQGLPVDQFETAVKRAQLLNQAAAETARRLSETARTGGEAATKAAAIGPKAGTQKQDPVKLEFRRRRR